MAPKEQRLPLDDLPSVDRGLIERRVLDRYEDALEHARGPRRWLLRRRVNREIEDELRRAEARAVRRKTKHSVHLF